MIHDLRKRQTVTLGQGEDALAVQVLEVTALTAPEFYRVLLAIGARLMRGDTGPEAVEAWELAAWPQRLELLQAHCILPATSPEGGELDVQALGFDHVRKLWEAFLEVNQAFFAVARTILHAASDAPPTPDSSAAPATTPSASS